MTSSSQTTRRGQIAMEFVMMVSLAMMVLIVFVAVVYFFVSDYSSERDIKGLQDLGYSLQNEVILASEVEPGYSRHVFIPTEDFEYAVSNSQTEIIFTYNGADIAFQIPEVQGSFVQGDNVIRKVDADTVRIN